MQVNTSFINLLNERYNESMESPNPNVQMPEPQVEIGSSVKKLQGGNFSIEGDILLVKCG
jgi:hypothetical protein